MKERPRRRGQAEDDPRLTYCVLSDGAFQHAAMKPLSLVFNRPVKVPGADDKHRFVVEGWLQPVCARRLARAADAARAINFVELDEATAVFDRADVRQRLAALCAPAPAPAPPAEDGIRDRSPSRGLGDVYKRQSQSQPRKLQLLDDPPVIMMPEPSPPELLPDPRVSLSLIHI